VSDTLRDSISSSSGKTWKTSFGWYGCTWPRGKKTVLRVILTLQERFGLTSWQIKSHLDWDGLTGWHVSKHLSTDIDTDMLCCHVCYTCKCVCYK
jgi:hypothetical protein